MKAFLFVLAGICATLGLLGAYLFFSRPAAVTALDQPGTSAAALVDLKTYSSSYGYSFSYPDTWVLVHATSSNNPSSLENISFNTPEGAVFVSAVKEGYLQLFEDPSASVFFDVFARDWVRVTCKDFVVGQKCWNGARTHVPGEYTSARKTFSMYVLSGQDPVQVAVALGNGDGLIVTGRANRSDPAHPFAMSTGMATLFSSITVVPPDPSEALFMPSKVRAGDRSGAFTVASVGPFDPSTNAEPSENIKIVFTGSGTFTGTYLDSEMGGLYIRLDSEDAKRIPHPAGRTPVLCVGGDALAGIAPGDKIRVTIDSLTYIFFPVDGCSPQAHVVKSERL